MSRKPLGLLGVFLVIVSVGYFVGAGVAYSKTHALVAELGVGAATHSALMLALGIAGLLAGLGVVCLAMGVAFLWHTRQSTYRAPDTIPEGLLRDTREKVNA